MLPSTDMRSVLNAETSTKGADRPFPAFFPQTANALLEARPAPESPQGRREKLIRQAGERIQAVLLELYDEHGIRAGQIEIDLRYSAYGKTEILC
jgi:hypothetical protein